MHVLRKARIKSPVLASNEPISSPDVWERLSLGRNSSLNWISHLCIQERSRTQTLLSRFPNVCPHYLQPITFVIAFRHGVTTIVGAAGGPKGLEKGLGA